MESDQLQQLNELFPFLHDANNAVRLGALQALGPHAQQSSPFRTAFLAGVVKAPTAASSPSKVADNDVLKDLKLLCRDTSGIAHEAFQILVNLSDVELVALSLSEPAFLAFLTSYIANPSSVLADLACILLANTTGQTEAASAALCTLKIPLLPLVTSSLPGISASALNYYTPLSRSGSCIPPLAYPDEAPVPTPALLVLVDAFVRAAKTELPLSVDAASRPNGESTATGSDVPSSDSKAWKGSLDFLGSVFMNVTRIEDGRLFFLRAAQSSPLALDKKSITYDFPLTRLGPFTEHPNFTRRKGACLTIRNCAFDMSAHRILLADDTSIVRSPESDLRAPGCNILAPILLPLTGPEEFDLDDMELLPSSLQFLPPTKKRELNPAIRQALVETLLLFSTTRKGRERLREKGVYAVVQKAHEVENVEDVAELVVRLVNLLKRDEGPDTLGDGDEFWTEEDEDDQIIEI